MKELCDELRSEYQELDDVVAKLDDQGWATPTPFLHWDVKYEIAHIAYFDGKARQAATDPDGFNKHVELLLTKEGYYEEDFGLVKDQPNADLLAFWRKERDDMLAALEPLGPKDRIPWYGPPMSARSFVTARMMETWAHGQDVIDALGLTRQATDRLRHIAHLGVTTYKWSFQVHGLAVPEAQVRVELTSPSGQVWDWGPDDSPERISGPAEDFCLVVIQRRHLLDTGLKVQGEAAEKWMEIAQCFAGPPANGPAPGVRKR